MSNKTARLRALADWLWNMGEKNYAAFLFFTVFIWGSLSFLIMLFLAVVLIFFVYPVAIWDRDLENMHTYMKDMLSDTKEFLKGSENPLGHLTPKRYAVWQARGFIKDLQL